MVDLLHGGLAGMKKTWGSGNSVLLRILLQALGQVSFGIPMRIDIGSVEETGWVFE